MKQPPACGKNHNGTTDRWDTDRPEKPLFRYPSEHIVASGVVILGWRAF